MKKANPAVEASGETPDGASEGTLSGEAVRAEVGGFLGRMRRRLRLVWAWSTGNMVAPFVAGASLLIVLIGWWRPWAWPEPTALIMLGVAVFVLVAWAAVQPLSVMASALAADRGLDSKDAFSSALQFESLESEFGHRIRDRADRMAATADPAKAAPLPNDNPMKMRWAIAFVLLAATVVLIIVANPQDSERERRAAEQAAVDELAEEVAALAELPEADGLTEELEALAEEVANAETLEEAKELLEQAQSELAENRSPEFGSQQAATQGLSRSLEQQPLTDDSGQTPSEQFDELAEDLDGMSEAERDALAERLSDLAEAQAAGDPATAEALGNAASELAAGDTAAAAGSLSDAAAAQAAAAASVAEQQAADAVAGELGALAGDGRTAEGAGQTPGQGTGEGAGQGSGGGEGASDGGAATSSQSNQGGSGYGKSPFSGIKDGDTTIDPAALEGDEVLGIEGSLSEGGRTESLGSADGPTTRNEARVPIADVAGEYADRASDAVDRQELSPSQERLVGDYFDRLTDG